MAELSFPTNPTLGQTYTSNGRTWRWAGDAWLIEPGSINDSSDVDVTAPASGEVLTYNGTTWENGSAPVWTELGRVNVSNTPAFSFTESGNDWGAYTWLVLRGNWGRIGSGIGVATNLQINGLSTDEYSYKSIYKSTTWSSTSATTVPALTFATAGNASHYLTEIWIEGGNTDLKVVHSNTAAPFYFIPTNTHSDVGYEMFGHVLQPATGKITQIDIFLASLNFYETEFVLWGVR